MVSEIYLWKQIREMPLLSFVWSDPETNVCDEIIKTLKIEFYYHANSLGADYGVSHNMRTFTVTK